jgi:hypothetical protein
MRILLRSLVLVAALSAACESNPASPSEQPLLTTTLQAGQQVSVSGLTATFIGVSRDSRCPINATCIASSGSAATMQFDLSANRRAARYDVLLSGPYPRPTRHQGFAIEVLDLQPFPFGGRPTPPGDYRATVKISGPVARP